MEEYNLKGTYEPGSLEEVVGEIGVVTKISKVYPPLAAYAFGTLWLASSFVGGFGGECFIDNGMTRYGVSMAPLGVLSATLIPSAFPQNKELLRITALLSAMGAATAYYLNR